MKTCIVIGACTAAGAAVSASRGATTPAMDSAILQSNTSILDFYSSFLIVFISHNLIHILFKSMTGASYSRRGQWLVNR